VVKRDPHGAAIQVLGTESYLSFQEAADNVPPVWPAEHDLTSHATVGL
jgi:hypothetical protein